MRVYAYIAVVALVSGAMQLACSDAEATPIRTSHGDQEGELQERRGTALLTAFADGEVLLLDRQADLEAAIVAGLETSPVPAAANTNGSPSFAVTPGLDGVELGLDLSGNRPRLRIGPFVDVAQLPVTVDNRLASVIDPLQSFAYRAATTGSGGGGRGYVPGIISTTVVDTNSAAMAGGVIDLDLGLTTIFNLFSSSNPLATFLNGTFRGVGPADGSASESGDVFISNVITREVEWLQPEQYPGVPQSDDPAQTDFVYVANFLDGDAIVIDRASVEQGRLWTATPGGEMAEQPLDRFMDSLGLSSNELQNLFNQLFGGAGDDQGPNPLETLVGLFGPGGSGGLQGELSGLLNQFLGSLGINGGSTIPFGGIEGIHAGDRSIDVVGVYTGSLTVTQGPNGPRLAGMVVIGRQLGSLAVSPGVLRASLDGSISQVERRFAEDVRAVEERVFEKVLELRRLRNRLHASGQESPRQFVLRWLLRLRIRACEQRLEALQARLARFYASDLTGVSLDVPAVDRVLATTTGLNERDTREALRAFVGVSAAALHNGRRITVGGLGTFVAPGRRAAVTRPGHARRSSAGMHGPIQKLSGVFFHPAFGRPQTQELVPLLAELTGFSAPEMDRFMAALSEFVRDELRQRGKARIPGFGMFTRHQHHDPGVHLTPGRRSVRFEPSARFQDMVLREGPVLWLALPSELAAPGDPVSIIGSGFDQRAELFIAGQSVEADFGVSRIPLVGTVFETIVLVPSSGPSGPVGLWVEEGSTQSNRVPIAVP